MGLPSACSDGIWNTDMRQQSLITWVVPEKQIFVEKKNQHL